MPLIRPTDPDFRVCRITFDTLLAIQSDAETRGWGTRWTSTTALRNQVKDADVLLQTLMRETHGETTRSYRCLALFTSTTGDGAITTIDLTPTRLTSLDRLDQDPAVRTAFAHIFALALNGISTITKE